MTNAFRWIAADAPLAGRGGAFCVDGGRTGVALGDGARIFRADGRARNWRRQRKTSSAIRCAAKAGESAGYRFAKAEDGVAEDDLLLRDLSARYPIRYGVDASKRAVMTLGVECALPQMSQRALGHRIKARKRIHWIGTAPHFWRADPAFGRGTSPLRIRCQAVSTGFRAKCFIEECLSRRRSAVDRVAWEQDVWITDQAEGSIVVQQVRDDHAIRALLIDLRECVGHDARSDDVLLRSAPNHARYVAVRLGWDEDSNLNLWAMVQEFILEDAGDARGRAVGLVRDIAGRRDGVGLSDDFRFERLLTPFCAFAALEVSKTFVCRRLSTHSSERQVLDVVAWSEHNHKSALQTAAKGQIADPRSGSWCQPRQTGLGRVKRRVSRLATGGRQQIEARAFRPTGPRRQCRNPRLAPKRRPSPSITSPLIWAGHRHIIRPLGLSL